MKSTVKQTAFLLIIMGAVAAPQAARAGEREEARKHYDRAIELVDDGQLDAAIVEFQRSYDLTHHFAVLYNIGQVFVSLARPVEAVDAYQRYLAEGGREIPPARLTEVAQEIARQRSRIATLEIRGLPGGAIIRVDAREIGRAPLPAPLFLGVGKHTIAASAEGFDSAGTEVTLAGEDRKVVELALARHVESPLAPGPIAPGPPMGPVAPGAPMGPMGPAAFGAPMGPMGPAAPGTSMGPPMAAAPTSAPVLSATVQPESKPLGTMRIAGIVTGAVGLAGVVVGAVCWGLASSRHSDAMSTWNQDYNKAQSLQGDAKNFGTAGNVSVIAGGVLTALGVVLYFVGAPDGQVATPNAHVNLMPALGPGFAGLNAGGTW